MSHTENFFVHEATNEDATLNWLTALSDHILDNCLRDGATSRCTLQEFNAMFQKETPLSTLFRDQLILEGIALIKANAIVAQYPTPRSLLDAYKSCEGSKQKERLLIGPIGTFGKSIGETVSKKVYEMFLV